MALLGSKVTGSAPSYATMIGAGVVKFAEERALAPVIGNATLVSAGVKGAIGFAAHKMLGGGLVGDSVSLGFTVDAVEDCLTALFAGNLGLSLGGGNQNDW